MLKSIFRSSNKEVNEDWIRESKAFCIMPWVHFHVTQNGTVTPCCQTPWEKEEAYGSLRDSDIEAIWNGKEIRSLRKKFLTDKSDSRCKRCYEKEENGWMSLRKITNEDYLHKIDLVNATKNDGSIDAQPVYLDIRFSNLCNFKCRICGPWSSSQWYKDAVEMGMVDENSPALTKGISNEGEFWNQIETLVPELEEIYFAGGEPLIMEEHYNFLEILHKHQKFDLVLKYNTNFSELTFKDWNVLELWKPFKKVIISASLDGMRAKGEYQRKNQDWKLTESNFQHISKSLDNVQFLISPTVNVFNLLHLFDFHKSWYDQGMIGKVDFIPSLLQNPEIYNIKILPVSLRQKAIVEIEGYINWLKEGEVQEATIMNFILVQWNSIIEILKEPPSGDLHKFRLTTEKLDKIRAEKFTDVFPELSEMMQ